MCETEKEQLEKLKSLINKGRDNEVACGRAVSPLAKHLPRRGRFILCIDEFTHSDGRTDLIIIEKEGVYRAEQTYASVWELKSPKKSLFKLRISTKRFIPTADLIQAESQLIQYVQSFQLTEELRRYNITNQQNVRPAGIIIGTAKSLCKNNSKAREKFDNDYDFEWSLYDLGLGSRRSLLYEPCHIKLLTWDEVVKNIETWLGEVIKDE